jgi:hypothetical protein
MCKVHVVDYHLVGVQFILDLQEGSREGTRVTPVHTKMLIERED